MAAPDLEPRDAAALVSRARELARQTKAHELRAGHLLAVFAQGAPGKAARDLRIACGRYGLGGVRPPVEPIPLAAGVEALLARHAGGRVPFDAVAALARAEDTLGHLARALDAWLSAPGEPEAPAEAPPPPDAPSAQWTRLELDDGDDIHFVELTSEGARLYVRSGDYPAKTRVKRAPREQIEIQDLRSEAEVKKSLARRIANLEKKEYRRTAPVQRPLPDASTREERERQRAASMADRTRRLERFEEQCVGFFEAWRAAGYDPERTFHQEGQRASADWNQLARACIDLAAARFGAHFTLLTIVDEEHGAVGAIGERYWAEHYVDPARVAEIALLRIRGELPRDDGAFPSWRSSAERERGREGALDPLVARALDRWRASLPPSA